MSTRRRPVARLLLAALLLLASAAASARAPAPDDPLDLRYDMFLAGVPVAEIDLRHENDGNAYGAEFSIRTRGLADVVLRYRGRAEIEGRKATDGTLEPLTYVDRYKRRDRTKTSRVRFDPATGEVAEVRIRKRGKPQQAELPDDARDVVDPLTAFLELRRGLARAAADQPPATVQVYDGRRRYDLEASVLGREQIRIAGQRWKALRVQLVVVPIAGFDEEDLTESGTAEGLETEVLLSDDGRLIPLEIRTLNAAVPVVFRLRDGCSDRAGCAASTVPAAAREDGALRRRAA